ncbi:PTS mannose/fructose/sorbose/N-acetylgalactosamine transporter subunit IIC [Holdemania massiliensis]|uniref:PTS mannose/fructose/sorbose/N-acetylgalactosamine transporter subunit IIC n=1 Tax=Holdemania massiliensis TaxID=1468449 RepID=UPI001F0635FF|nr:PTS sugar transporter subunit IIC [Holdemania massiliensis]MCH1942341.1 PTS sugar transporter subunit IIC [Holdemania massiliensis]
MIQALLIALTYYICQCIDGFVGFQTATRPIILGSVTGLVCGDLKTGVIMGAELEAIYMGISGIGGVVAADYRTSTAVGVGLTILSGISIEQGLAIAVPIGALMNSVNPITQAISNSIQPISTRLANAGEVQKFRWVMILEMLFVRFTLPAIIIFLCCFYGSEAVEIMFQVVPAWLLNGLSAAGGMLVVVGLCLTTQAIFSQSTPFYVLLGFILAKYLGLSTLPIAILALILAYVGFTRNYKMQEIEKKISTGGGDDFYG